MRKNDRGYLDQDFDEGIRNAERVKPAFSPLDVLKGLASLRLTLVLFVFAFILVFLGTLAQVDASNWTVINTYFRSVYVIVPFKVLLTFFQTFLGVSKETEWYGGFPFPGGLSIGILLLVNLLAAHLVRFKLSWKRSGILMLHAGVVVLMVGELGTRFTAIEGNMTIQTGKSSNYLEHLHAAELAIIDPSDSETDNVVVVPDSILKEGGVISDPLLPLDIEVVKYMPNSGFQRQVPEGTKNLATAGMGLRVSAIEKKEGSGVDSNQKVDIPSAYLTFKKKGTGENQGTYLVSMYYAFLKNNEQITVDGKTYDLALRLKRTYKPYRVYLKEFHHDNYMGTEMARNYASLVRLVDSEDHEDREFNIHMNYPLRHAGETFYQSSVLGDDEGTVLQVVRNPVWILPYISCFLVTFGMLLHFGINFQINGKPWWRIASQIAFYRRIWIYKLLFGSPGK